MTRDKLRPGVTYSIEVGTRNHENWVKAWYSVTGRILIGKRFFNRYHFKSETEFYSLASLVKVRRLPIEEGGDWNGKSGKESN